MVKEIKMDIASDVEVEIRSAKPDEQEISLEEVISNTTFVNEQSNKDETLTGSYVCVLSYEQNSDCYFVNHPFNDQDIIPIFGSTIDLQQELSGTDVLVVFNENNANNPIVTGIMNKCIHSKNLNTKIVSVKKDKEKTLVFEAEKEIVLKCGKSSITLTKAGKVLIRGAYLLSRSSGANRIKGGSVHLN